ncbi:hypothetical protein E5288_WYG022324 [Bos mutus]|uniref:Uncharacterized protein n=1 Tax=Bos mutus TaxID=72004 RepID=A0A6B0RU50_9CETA|nr:hypothetical protein [Bos mutus]
MKGSVGTDKIRTCRIWWRLHISGIQWGIQSDPGLPTQPAVLKVAKPLLRSLPEMRTKVRGCTFHPASAGVLLQCRYLLGASEA